MRIHLKIRKTLERVDRNSKIITRKPEGRFGKNFFCLFGIMIPRTIGTSVFYSEISPPSFCVSFLCYLGTILSLLNILYNFICVLIFLNFSTTHKLYINKYFVDNKDNNINYTIGSEAL